MTRYTDNPASIPALAAEGADEIVIKSGFYSIGEPIILKGARGLSIKGEGSVRLAGGKALSGAEYVSGGELSLFREEARGKIMKIGLAANGIYDTGSFASRGFGRPVTPSHSEVFIGGVPLKLSQYPKNGFLQITGFATSEGDEGWGAVNGKLSDGFYYNCNDTRPKLWHASEDIIVHGYWSYDWANSYENVEILDAEKGFVKNCPPYGNYQFRVGQRFCFLNILEEITEPGDYYIDRRNNILYFIPPENTGVDIGEIVISLSSRPAFVFEDCFDVSLSGVAIEAFRGDGVMVKGGSRVKIEDCRIHNIGNCGVVIKSCRGAQINGCDIYDCGDGGISAEGGDRATLESAEILIYNNHIHHVAKWTRCYQAAANITGVGITVSHNLIHDLPHTAVLWWGNDMKIADNEIYSVVLETGDAGAVYSGRDYTCRGNVVSRNYIHHLGGVGMGTMGIYNDDCLSGTVMEDNFFCECSRAVFLGGGRDFIVQNNVFKDCYPCVSVDGRGKSDHKMWRGMINTTLRERFYNIGGYVSQNETESGIKPLAGIDSPYIDRYPALADIDAFYKNGEEIPHIPASAVIRRNVFHSKREIELDWDSDGGSYDIGENWSVGAEVFCGAAFGDLTLKENSAPVKGGVKRNIIGDIGLIEAERKTLPARVKSCLSRRDGGVILNLRNERDEKSEGSYTIYAEGGGTAEVAFSLGGRETAEFVIADKELCGAKKLAARSSLPGARPAAL